jgi:hypothetical protein
MEKSVGLSRESADFCHLLEGQDRSSDAVADFRQRVRYAITAVEQPHTNTKFSDFLKMIPRVARNSCAKNR